MSDFDYSQLDPGIRGLVHWLHGHGFNTTDSGDGVTKVDTMECAQPYPNVAIATNPESLISEARRLRDLLHDIVLPCSENENSPWIQAAYDPSDDKAVILIINVNDELLRSKGYSLAI